MSWAFARCTTIVYFMLRGCQWPARDIRPAFRKRLIFSVFWRLSRLSSLVYEHVCDEYLGFCSEKKVGHMSGKRRLQIERKPPKCTTKLDQICLKSGTAANIKRSRSIAKINKLNRNGNQTFFQLQKAFFISYSYPAGLKKIRRTENFQFS